MSKPVCVRSTVFKVCQDELTSELLRALPLTTWTDLDRVFFNAHENARKHLEAHPKLQGRHSRYKVRLFFQSMANRLPDVSNLLANTLQLKGAEKLESPDVVTDFETVEDKAFDKVVRPLFRETHSSQCMSVTHIGAPCNCGLEVKRAMGGCLCGPDGKPGLLPCPIHSKPLDEVLRQMSAARLDPDFVQVRKSDEEEEQEPESEDEFEHLLDDLPTFEDYQAVFLKWPYIYQTQDKDGNGLLVIGYLSGRDPNTDALVRRNCALNGTPFKGVQSMVGLLKKTINGNRCHIKVVPLRVGDKIRFWTNVRGEGDREKYNRYFVVDAVEGLKQLPTRSVFDSVGLQ